MKKGISSWKNLVRFVLYYFSFRGLLRTLLVPWHREKHESNERGAWKIVEQVTFFLFAVVFGFVVRVTTIAVGLGVLILVLLLFPIFLLVPINIRFEDLVRFGSLGREWAYPVTYELNKHGRDLRHLPEFLVRDHDHGLEQIERILSRRTQQNVLVVGTQGIGKTTRLGHLARKMYRDLSVPALNGKRLVQLFPEEMSVQDIQTCIQEAIRARNVVLVIENIEHMNIIPILEPYFDTHHFQMILTTDQEAYHQQYKHNSNLMRVCEIVPMYPPDAETTLLYLQDWVFQNKAQGRISRDILKQVIDLTDVLMLNISQPEKSIDILEELLFIPDKIITQEHVESLLSQKTQVPLGALRRDEKDVLLHLEDMMKSYVVGQDSAIISLASALKRGRMNITETKKPIGSFLFLGPTGVGKTYTAKILARSYFGGEGQMIRYDMSEFQDTASVTRFMEHLASSVEAQPFGLLFFDEIEKAHPDILNLFLHMLDEGVMHTMNGRAIAFHNMLIICTSNAGALYMRNNDTESKDLIINDIIQAGVFKPELINRFDDVVVFRSLDRKAIQSIARMLLKDLNRFLLKHHRIEILITDELVDELARKGHDPQFGMRPLHRVIQEDIQTEVADYLLRHDDANVSLIIDPSRLNRTV